MLKLLCTLLIVVLPYVSFATESLEKELANALKQSTEAVTGEENRHSTSEDSEGSEQKDSHSDQDEPTPKHSGDAGDEIINEEESVDPNFLHKGHVSDSADNPSILNHDSEDGSNSDEIGSSKSNFKKIAILQGLNKITTDISSLKIPVNSSLRFGNLIIRVTACWQAPQELKPENKILMRISEIVPGDVVEKDIFYGWMLSSSPAISSISHPVYDIIAISCSE
jgi:hypothetical protein